MFRSTEYSIRLCAMVLAFVVQIGFAGMAGGGGSCVPQPGSHPCPDHHWFTLCPKEGPVDSATCQGLEAQAVPLLTASSQWYERLDLGPPKLDGDACEFHIWRRCFVPGFDAHMGVHCSPKSIGSDTMNHATYLFQLEQIHLSPEIACLSGGDNEDLCTRDSYEGFGGEEQMLTVVHELFHAHAKTHTGGSPGLQAEPYQWIHEGMAEAAMVAFAKENSEFGRANPAAGRRFDIPLYETENKGYDTWPFWLAAGRSLESPSRIAFFRQVLEGLACHPAPPGLKGVDAGLEGWGRLYKVFPGALTQKEIPWDKANFGRAEDLGRVTLPTEVKKKRWTRPAGKVTVREIAGKHLKLKVEAGDHKGPVELEIRFKEPDEELHLLVDRQRYDGPLSPNLYRELLQPGESREVEVLVANVAKEAKKSQEKKFQLDIGLREVGYCSMSARMSGDITGSYFGDVAHFSTSGGATTYGAFSNPEIVEGMMEGFADMAEQMGDEGAKERIEAMNEEWRAEANQLPRETFGLSLTDQKLDTDDDQAALATLVGGFTLEASALDFEVPEGFTGGIPLKSLRVVPGPRAESTYDKVPFVWAEGEPGSAQLEITLNTDGRVAGWVSGTLYAEGYRKTDGSKPMIQVQANFVALPGPMGCINSMFF